MPKHRRTKSQAARDRRALEKLRSGGYRGKVDLRRAPTKYQQQKIKEAREHDKRSRAARKAAKTRAANQRKPMPRGQPKGGRVRRRVIKGKDLTKLKLVRNELVTFALPFNRKGGETEWRRFTRAGLKAFLASYVPDRDKREKWGEYAVEERWSFGDREERREFKEELEEEEFGEQIDRPKFDNIPARDPYGRSEEGLME